MVKKRASVEKSKPRVPEPPRRNNDSQPARSSCSLPADEKCEPKLPMEVSDAEPPMVKKRASVEKSKPRVPEPPRRNNDSQPARSSCSLSADGKCEPKLPMEVSDAEPPMVKKRAPVEKSKPQVPEPPRRKNDSKPARSSCSLSADEPLELTRCKSELSF
ncbi:hypothetical protein SASPL_115393 [Salvia splendens]|uniref:Uncharacterized protein n=1 Tax=Salvia splendens TaxID=180675 RepID=A0A8X8Y7G6_SALSN|nr:hypothetical protein SASPL_115393 [Salvia splendens]